MVDLSYIIQDMTDEIETIKWDNKKYKMPFKADYSRQKDDSFKELIIVKNRFGNEFSRPETKIANIEKITAPIEDPIIIFLRSYLSESDPIGH